MQQVAAAWKRQPANVEIRLDLLSKPFNKPPIEYGLEALGFDCQYVSPNCYSFAPCSSARSA